MNKNNRIFFSDINNKQFCGTEYIEIVHNNILHNNIFLIKKGFREYFPD